MPRPDPNGYLNSTSFLRLQNQRRFLRKLYLTIEGVEPRGKRAMPDADKLQVQMAVLRYLGTHRKRAFRCPLAVKVRLETTGKNPPQPHNIVKNLLDLLARPASALPTRRHALVYLDDSQISALAVTCQHARPTPSIHIEVAPLRDLLDPLEIAWKSGNIPDGDDDRRDENALAIAVDWLADFRENKAWWLSKIGNEEYERFEHFARQRVQEPFWERGGLTVSDLVMMFNLPGRGSDFDSACLWDEGFASSLLHIRLAELPQSPGESAPWQNQVNTKLEEFRSKYGRLVKPLLVPVALEVLVRPPPLSRENNVHDLDNVLRTYLLPRVLHLLKPPSHYAFTVGDLQKNTPSLSTRIGVPRYEVWRLPPAPEGSDGFVHLAIVTDFTGHRSVIGRIENVIERWVSSLD